MSLIEFESSRVKDAERENLRRARERILAEAEEKYRIKEAKAERSRQRGDDKWMLPSVEEKLSSDKSKKKKKKDKKKKKTKKRKRKRSTSSSSSDSSSEDEKEEWVEKSSSKEQSKPLEREEWMNLSSAFACSSREKKNKKTDEKKDTLDNPGHNIRKLNPYWKNDGAGLPEDAIKKPNKPTMDPAWLKKSLQRAREQAMEEGKTLEEIAEVRWGSLDKIKSMIEEAEINSRSSSNDYSSRRNYDYDKRRRRSRSRSRSRDRSRQNYHNNYKHSDFSSEKKLSFKKPTDNNDSSSNYYSKSSSSSSRKNWQKPKPIDNQDNNVKEVPITSYESIKKTKDKRSSPSSSSSESEKEKEEEPTKSNDIKILSEDELNKLGAAVIKAELRGDEKLAMELKEKLDNARELKLKNPQIAVARRVDNKSEENVILTLTDAKGMTRPLEQRSKYQEPQGGRRKTKKVSTHESGERVRHYADDDKYNLKDLFVKEKGESSSNNDEAVFVKMASKNMDMDELFELNITKESNDSKNDLRDKMKAINEHKKIEKSLDNCYSCFDSKKMLKHLIVAMGNKMYVSLPSHESLTPGHCIISPIHHVACQTQLDEDFYDELKLFKTSLTKMFTDNNECPVFFEISMGLKRFPHMQMICVSLPEDVGSMAPMYFKKALLECETEWSTNKKVVDLSKKDIRSSIPKGLPYFMVDFGNYGGFAHVIEDEMLFPINFAQEIIGGMLDLDSAMWRRPKRQTFDQQRKKVIEFGEKWKKYDFTTT
ncbi:hypothetical protein HCN44_008286 [Aphidius gifuensis]|uniref:CWF19-like protein n=1 Tax=Aphidius gifuensis TaxID=684658 RepID=A0A835CMU9_APHGI|nr:CWF19-like protein 2 [Aphidius gifuensis]KAF7989612.1 hypothetical protein HCN44_008286 [Aphidius gifuensis]